MFGYDDSVIVAAEKMAKAATGIMKGIRDKIASVQGAAKRPEIAKSLGVDVNDPEGVKKRIQELKVQLWEWSRWEMNPELANELRKRTGLTKITEGTKPLVPEIPSETVTELPGRKVTADKINAMFDTKDSRTGEPSAKGEPVYYLTDPSEIVKESTYKGMTEGGKQGEVFAPGEVKKVPVEAKPKQPTKVVLKKGIEPVTEEKQISMLNGAKGLTGQHDMFEKPPTGEEPKFATTKAIGKGITNDNRRTLRES